MAIMLFLLYLVVTLVIVSRSVNPRIWEILSGIYLISSSFFTTQPWLISVLLCLVIASIVILLRVEPVRGVVSDFVFYRLKKSIPKLSKTEEDALNAGDVWFEKNIFTGALDWDALGKIKQELSPEEQSFLDNETATLCSMVNEWEIAQNFDLPPAVWAYMKEQGFFGLVISKQYGGKGFSALAHSEIILKITSHCSAAAVSIMVPNSLGPGELLQHYGTKEQKDYYLPRLANGTDIPCFALTEPDAGSDATSIKSEAVVVQKKVGNKTVLGLNLTLNKRWITLSPIASLIGLAVNLVDPNGLLKGKGSEGITCLLISRDTENLEIGNRHLPGGQVFMNGSIRAENVFVPITSIIGGIEQAGQGWPMLVECLSIGRAISLPALSSASASVSYLTSGAFARIRRQFNVELAQFEGIEEKLAEIAGLNYMVNATRLLTLAAVDAHKKPSVASAIAKYFNTELARITINHAMDIHGGRAVVVGPRNYLSGYYQSIPISVTVEGANIMTRNLLIFGQGSMACHPYVRDEFYAITQDNKESFKPIFWGHIGYFFLNFAKAVCSAWTGGMAISAPSNSLKRAYKQLSRLSYAYAWLADLSLICLGGDLKRKERLSARLADGLSYLYMAMATLKYYQQYPNEEACHHVHAEWAVTYCFHQAQKAMMGLCRNFPSRVVGIVARFLMFPFGQTMAYPSDKLDHRLAKNMVRNNHYRKKLTKYVYLSGDSRQPIDKVENALQLMIKHEALYAKVSDLRRYRFAELKEHLAKKVSSNELTQQEMDTLVDVERARWDAIQVDEFTLESVKNRKMVSLTDGFKIPF